MNINYLGNFISINISANEGQSVLIRLKDGYSYEEIFIISASNMSFYENLSINKGDYLRFPPINSKSPCTLKPVITDKTKSATLQFLITKFGQIPDFNYFNGAFKPVLVTGDNGIEYPIIPSDQFK